MVVGTLLLHGWGRKQQASLKATQSFLTDAGIIYLEQRFTAKRKLHPSFIAVLPH